MTCPACRADNHARRRYCGKCGCNFDPACQDCGFANERDDRFCGGCGLGLRSDGRVLPAALPAANALPAVTTWPVDELAGLFVRPEVLDDGPQLPETGVAQDDLDRLFGGTP